MNKKLYEIFNYLIDKIPRDKYNIDLQKLKNIIYKFDSFIHTKDKSYSGFYYDSTTEINFEIHFLNNFTSKLNIHLDNNFIDAFIPQNMTKFINNNDIEDFIKQLTDFARDINQNKIGISIGSFDLKSKISILENIIKDAETFNKYFGNFKEKYFNFKDETSNSEISFNINDNLFDVTSKISIIHPEERKDLFEKSIKIFNKLYSIVGDRDSISIQFPYSESYKFVIDNYGEIDINIDKKLFDLLSDKFKNKLFTSQLLNNKLGMITKNMISTNNKKIYIRAGYIPENDIEYITKKDNDYTLTIRYNQDDNTVSIFEVQINNDDENIMKQVINNLKLFNKINFLDLSFFYNIDYGDTKIKDIVNNYIENSFNIINIPTEGKTKLTINNNNLRNTIFVFGKTERKMIKTSKFTYSFEINNIPYLEYLDLKQINNKMKENNIDRLLIVLGRATFLTLENNKVKIIKLHEEHLNNKLTMNYIFNKFKNVNGFLNSLPYVLKFC